MTYFKNIFSSSLIKDFKSSHQDLHTNYIYANNEDWTDFFKQRFKFDFFFDYATVWIRLWKIIFKT